MSTTKLARACGAPQRTLSQGWTVVTVMFLAQMLVIGITSYGFGLLVKPIAAEYALRRADVNVGLMLLLVGMAVASPLIGYALDRLPGRIVIAMGALVFGAGTTVVAMATSLWVMAAAAFFLMSAGTAALGPLTAATLTSRWFTKSRGPALGIVTIATSTGGLVVLPLMAALVGQFGWRGALAILGAAVTLLIGGLGLLFVREPDARETECGGEPLATPAIEQKRWTTAQLLLTRDFWLIAVSIGLLFAVDQALLASLIAYGTDRGYSVQAAAMLVSVISGSAIVGKLVFGALSDHVDLRWLLVAAVLLTEGFLGVLLIEPSYSILMIACLFVGAAVGGSLPLWASSIGLRFGLASYGATMGLMVPLQMPLVLVALRYIGHVYDAGHTYAPGFSAFAVVVIIAGLAILPVKMRAARR